MCMHTLCITEYDDDDVYMWGILWIYGGIIFSIQ